MNDPPCYLSNWSVKGAWLAKETIYNYSITGTFLHGMTECVYNHGISTHGWHNFSLLGSK